ncbi:MAG TPA: precorrin-3B synthase [Xanthobacteraceae bacterium]|jgi:precorrin-3B synthase|nr:precorrin-3B synthase [Xanthobacteraceae bacterium]
MTMNATAIPQRRGACPGLSAPMQTGDGLLVRLLPIGTIPLPVFAALRAAARTHGNGVIEITSRGSIQIRGVSIASAPQFAAAISALDIAAADGVPILCIPLAGLDATEMFDSAALAADLREALAHSSLRSKLSPKVSVVIDGGGAIGLDAVAADVRLHAQAMDGGLTLRVSVGGDEARAIDLGHVTLPHGVETIMRLLDVIARHGRDARARDIVATEGVPPLRSAIAELLITARPRESGDLVLDSRFRGNERKVAVGSVIGTHPLRDGAVACGVGLAFGHADATSLERLDVVAKAAGASGLRTAPGRVLLAIGLAPEAAPTFTSAAAQLGFIVRADDPRRNVIACAGAPICTSAHIASRALAPLVAATAAQCFDGVIHISGCAKGCAHPAPAALTVVGTPEGCGLIADGTARDTPFATVPADELPAALTRYARQHNRGAAHV